LEFVWNVTQGWAVRLPTLEDASESDRANASSGVDIRQCAKSADFVERAYACSAPHLRFHAATYMELLRCDSPGESDQAGERKRSFLAKKGHDFAPEAGEERAFAKHFFSPRAVPNAKFVDGPGAAGFPGDDPFGDSLRDVAGIPGWGDVLKGVGVGDVEGLPAGQVGGSDDGGGELARFAMGANHFYTFKCAASHWGKAIHLRAGIKVARPIACVVVDD